MVPIGIVLAFLIPCCQCCGSCCCSVNDDTPNRYVTGMVSFSLSLVLLLIAFILLFFAFSGGAKSINGIFNVGCAAQSLIYPTMVLGYNNSENKIGFDNSSFCFDLFLKDNVATKGSAF